MNRADDGLSLHGLQTRAGSFALGPIDLAVGRDRVLALLGPSGAGKTMLLETLAGFRKATAGSIVLDGKELTHLTPERRRIGFVFQDAALFPHLSVAENVRFPLRARGETNEKRVAMLLARFDITRLADRAPRSLSGGERQRVALARALAGSPDLLLLDEPLSSLDQPTREDLRGVLEDLLGGLGIPTIHVTHDRDEALSIGDEVAIIVGGRLRQRTPAAATIGDPADAAVARLLGWLGLGHGHAHNGAVTVGDLTLPTGKRLEGRSGTVDVFYRPEDVVLGSAATAPGMVRLDVRVARVLPTSPLARVVFSGTPPLNALVLPRELAALAVRVSAPVTVGLPGDSLRMFPAEDGGSS